MDLQINGVLSKAFDRNMFAQCFTSIELGKVYMSQEHADELKYYQQSQLLGERRFDKEISTRQYETLLMISKGFSNKEIAKRMDISESTVKSHVAALMTLFEADNRTHCVSEAQRLSIILIHGFQLLRQPIKLQLCFARNSPMILSWLNDNLLLMV